MTACLQSLSGDLTATFDRITDWPDSFNLKFEIEKGEDFDLDNLDDFIHLTNHSVQGNVEF